MSEKEANNIVTEAAALSIEQNGDTDSAQLARLGKSQVLRLHCNDLLGSSTLVSFWMAKHAIDKSAKVRRLFGIGFASGGYAGSFWGYLLVWLGNLSSFATMAELASMAPTAAGQYHWVSMLATPKSRTFLSYVIVTGWFAVVASTCFLSTQIVQGMAVMTHPDYVIMQWQIPLIFWLVLIVGVLFNTVAVRLLPQVEALVMILHVLGYIAILVPILVYGMREDAAVVFNTWLNTGDWPTQGLSFLVGLVGPAFGLLGGDAAVHMAEEIRKPALNVPRAVMASVVINGALGFSMLIVELFYLGDSDTVLNTPLGFPFMALFQQAVGQNAGAVTMVAIVFVLLICCTVSCIATASRLTWAFARDRGLPGWTIWSKIEGKTQTPILSVGLVAIIAFVLSFIGFGSTLAFNDVVSLTVANLYTSYLIGNTLLLYRRVMGQIEPFNPGETDIVNTIGASRLTWGPWRIPGVLGIINNIIGCAFLFVMLVFSFFPLGTAPDPAAMNWSVLMAGTIAIVALLYYVVLGRKTYKGPIVENTKEDGY